MGCPDLIRRLGGSLRPAGLALALVLCTLLAEGLDLVELSEHRAGFPWSAELIAAGAGLVAAWALGSWVERRFGGSDRGSQWRRVVLSAAALGGALLVHELTAVGFHAEHCAGVANLAAHIAESVAPVSIAVGVTLALVVGVRAGRWVAAAPWTSIVVPAHTSTPSIRIAPGRRAGLSSGLTLAPRLAGRAPPVPAG